MNEQVPSYCFKLCNTSTVDSAGQRDNGTCSSLYVCWTDGGYAACLLWYTPLKKSQDICMSAGQVEDI